MLATIQNIRLVDWLKAETQLLQTEIQVAMCSNLFARVLQSPALPVIKIKGFQNGSYSSFGPLLQRAKNVGCNRLGQWSARSVQSPRPPAPCHSPLSQPYFSYKLTKTLKLSYSFHCSVICIHCNRPGQSLSWDISV